MQNRVEDPIFWCFEWNGENYAFWQIVLNLTVIYNKRPAEILDHWWDYRNCKQSIIISIQQWFLYQRITENTLSNWKHHDWFWWKKILHICIIKIFNDLLWIFYPIHHHQFNKKIFFNLIVLYREENQCKKLQIRIIYLLE